MTKQLLYTCQPVIRQWLNSRQANGWIQEELRLLHRQTKNCFGCNALQLGVSDSIDLLVHFALRNTLLLASDEAQGDKDLLFAEPQFLPLADDCCDVVLIYHLHELLDEPHDFIREATRIIRPEGRIYIVGSSPSLTLRLPGSANWQHRLRAGRLKDWLRLLQFEDIRIEFGRLMWFEHHFPKLSLVTRWIFRLIPCANSYCIVATKRTPAMLMRTDRKYPLVSSLWSNIPSPTAKLPD